MVYELIIFYYRTPLIFIILFRNIVHYDKTILVKRFFNISFIRESIKEIAHKQISAI